MALYKNLENMKKNMYQSGNIEKTKIIKAKNSMDLDKIIYK